MTHDDVITPRRGLGYSNRGAAHSRTVTRRDSSDPGGALSFGPDERQAFVARVQAMTLTR